MQLVPNAETSLAGVGANTVDALAGKSYSRGPGEVSREVPTRRRHPASCPFALNTAPAAGVVRNLISAFAADESFEPTPTPAWKTV